MPNQIEYIRNISPKSSDIFFFDNNVWMYLLCPIGNYNSSKQNAYSSLLGQLLSRQLHIYTTSLVLSEFANRYLRLDWNIEKMKPENAGAYTDFKKNYIPSARGRAIISDVKIHLKKIIDWCQKCSDEFPSININEVLVTFQDIGFNDAYYAILSSKKNWIIVTEDSDFVGGRIPDKNLRILTA